MNSLGQVMTHMRRVLLMGQKTGVDLVAIHRNGRMTHAEWADMIHRCRGCEWAESCGDWLEAQDQTAEVPGKCPNRKRFAEIREQQGWEL